MAAGQAAAADNVVRETLPNGLKVVIVRDPLAAVVTTVMNYQVGAVDEDITGLAHAQEHMMFRGSQSLSASEFADVTAITGGNFNASTGSTVTQYYFVMPSQDLDLALHLEASRASGLLDTQKLWDQERKAIMQEVTQDNSDAEYRLYVKELHRVLAGTPYADEGLGTLESFGKQVNAPQLQAFYKAWYHPNNALLVIAGDVDPAVALEKVKKTFGPIPSAPLPARKPVALTPPAPATLRETSDKPYVMANLVFRYPGYDDPDYAAGQVLSDVLNSQRAALFELQASGKALAADFGAETFPQAGIAFAEIAVPVGSKPEDAAGTLRQVLEQYRKDGLPPELVEVAKQREVATAEFKANSIEGLAMEWSQALAVEHRNAPDDDVAAIQKVTVDDVNRVYRQYLNLETAAVGYSVPKNEGQMGTSESRHSENNTIIPSEHRPLPAWARHTLENLQVPHQTLHPTRMKLSNGITLIVQPETITHTVELAGNIRHSAGLQAPPGKEGVATLTENLLPYGTTTSGRLQFQAELDKIAADVSTGTSFSLSVLSSHFDRGVELLADDELHPAFAQADFDILKKELYDRVKGAEKTPDHLADVARSRALYPPGDPERRFATPASVQHLTVDAVKQWHASAYRPDMTTIVVVGDVTPEQAREAIEKYFGGWKAVGPPPVVDPPPVPDNRVSSVTIPDTGRVQDEVTMAETLRLRHQDPDYPTLQLADTVLTGGFYASLLYHNLREVRGYVYSVESSLSAERTRGEFEIDFGASPENVSRAEAATVAELRNLQRTLLPEDRLQKAKALLLGQVPIRQRSYTGVAHLLLRYDALGLPLDQYVIDARHQLEVTPARLRDAMRRWIRPDGFVRIVQGPAPR